MTIRGVVLSDLIKLRFLQFFSYFLLSFSFDVEDLSNTQDSGLPHFRTPQSSPTILCYSNLDYHLEALSL